MSNNYFNRASGLLQQDWSNASLLLAQSCQHTSASRFDAIASKALAGLFPRAYDVSRPRPRQVSTDLPNCPRLIFGCAHDDEMPQVSFSSVIGKPH
jgi:hypothetical protein